MDARSNPLSGVRDSSFSMKKARQFSGFLYALQDAYEYALDLNCSIWEFAISPTDVGVTEVQINDLRWMIRKGWIHHDGELATAQDGRLSSQRGELTIHADSCFVIGKKGIDVLARVSAEGPCVAESQQGVLPTTNKPFWDAERHELSFVGQIVKRFRWPAANQETILMAFEEESWPSRIDDPLPQVSDVDPKRRLSDSIKCLNRNQRRDLVRFRGDGTGQGIFWDAQRVR